MGEPLILKAFQEAKDEQVRELLNAIDAETGNKLMEMLSEKYGFPVVEIEGQLVTSREYVNLLFEVADKNHLPTMWRGIGLNTRRLQAAGFENMTPIKAKLGINKFANDVLLPGWQEILVAGIHGRGERAMEIKKYLLGMEKYARMESHVQETEGKTLTEYASSRVQYPQTHEDIIRTVSNDTISISKNRYIELLEGEVRILRLWRPNTNKPPRPLSAREKEEALILRKEGLGYIRIARITGRSPTTIRKFLTRMKL